MDKFVKDLNAAFDEGWKLMGQTIHDGSNGIWVVIWKKSDEELAAELTEAKKGSMTVSG